MTKLEKVIACFKELNFSLDINDFENRLIAQKVVCLLELKGIDLEYPVSLYVRGPYSPVLTKDLYNHSDRISGLETEDSLDEQEIDVVDKLKEIFGLSASLLEIGATYGFLNQRLHLNHVESLRELKRMKPFIPEPMISLGVSKTKEFFQSVSDESIEDMKNEFRAWQNASFFD